MSAPTIRITRLHPRDAGAFKRFRLQAIADSPAAHPMTEAEERRATDDGFAARLSGPPGAERFVLVAHDGQDAAGFDERSWLGACGFYRQSGAQMAHIGWFWGLHVVPARRRSGIASSLLRSALQNLTTIDNLAQAQARVGIENLAAQRTFVRAGFDSVAILPRAVRIGAREHDEVLYVHRIDPERPRPA
ncbi:MAG: N-acetyltransferase family protein [Lautropia sp.]